MQTIDLQKTHNGHLAEAVEVERAIIAELGSQVDDRKRGGILQRVGQVLIALANLPTRACPP